MPKLRRFEWSFLAAATGVRKKTSPRRSFESVTFQFYRSEGAGSKFPARPPSAPLRTKAKKKATGSGGKGVSIGNHEPRGVTPKIPASGVNRYPETEIWNSVSRVLSNRLIKFSAQS
ncbi:hypothetical protein KM043_016445 [Ampulex compressa]|nr:hypothetical protein KM043_016445 [Ampulex compressa]